MNNLFLEELPFIISFNILSQLFGIFIILWIYFIYANDSLITNLFSYKSIKYEASIFSDRKAFIGISFFSIPISFFFNILGGGVALAFESFVNNNNLEISIFWFMMILPLIGMFIVFMIWYKLIYKRYKRSLNRTLNKF
ncbi:MAG: hypothetical protein ACRCVI_02280, partial [Mycoplasmoidaceae bacterium]